MVFALLNSQCMASKPDYLALWRIAIRQAQAREAVHRPTSLCMKRLTDKLFGKAGLKYSILMAERMPKEAASGHLFHLLEVKNHKRPTISS